MYFLKKSKEVAALGGFATHSYQEKITFFKNTRTSRQKRARVRVETF